MSSSWGRAATVSRRTEKVHSTCAGSAGGRGNVERCGGRGLVRLRQVRLRLRLCGNGTAGARWCGDQTRLRCLSTPGAPAPPAGGAPGCTAGPAGRREKAAPPIAAHLAALLPGCLLAPPLLHWLAGQPVVRCVQPPPSPLPPLPAARHWTAVAAAALLAACATRSRPRLSMWQCRAASWQCGSCRQGTWENDNC